MSKVIRFPERLHVGDSKVIAVDAYTEDGDSAGADADPDSATVHGVDPNRPVEGTCGTGSGATTLVDPDVLGAYVDNALRGLSVVLVDADGREYHSEITGNSQAGGSATIYPLEIAPSAGDGFRILGHPLLPQTDAQVTGNRVSYQVSPTDMTAYPAQGLYLVFGVDYGDGADKEEVVVEFSVGASAP